MNLETMKLLGQFPKMIPLSPEKQKEFIALTPSEIARSMERFNEYSPELVHIIDSLEGENKIAYNADVVAIATSTIFPTGGPGLAFLVANSSTYAHCRDATEGYNQFKEKMRLENYQPASVPMLTRLAQGRQRVEFCFSLEQIVNGIVKKDGQGDFWLLPGRNTKKGIRQLVGEFVRLTEKTKKQEGVIPSADFLLFDK